MKFTDGFWLDRPGVNAQYAAEAYDIETSTGEYGEELKIYAPTRVIADRGDTLNRALLTITLFSPRPGVLGVRAEHHQGGRPHQGFDLDGSERGAGKAHIDEAGATFTTGDLTARVTKGAPWDLTFTSRGKQLTASGHKSVGYMQLGPGATVTAEPAGVTGVTKTGLAPHPTYMHTQLQLSVGELVYGLGERFGPLTKNGQTVDIWHSDGGTSSEQAYKNVPFYLTNRGYGVLVNHPEHVSFEIGSEAVEQVQFSVAGEHLEYFLIDGPTPADVLDNYTQLTGRPAAVPAWSYGLWLSTSFTTNYDEETVNHFIDGMRERDLPLEVFHFDCFWMREFDWTSFEWDKRTFPDPEGMIARLQKRGLHLSAWVNPYIAQRSAIFAEGLAHDYFVKRPDGTVWQWDMWQAGMALVDFTNPAAKAWYQDKIRTLLKQGIHAIKTDFGERIPVDVIWHDESDPYVMHNWYTQLYNEAVFEVMEEELGKGQAVLFARSATMGGQKMPVHWGGDNSSSYESMAESLRAGLSMSLSGFGYWSHDIGGFEGNPDPGVFKRWLAFGLMSSHSRLHGSKSYRVPWIFDTGEEDPGQSAVDVTRTFTNLKKRLMPYLYEAGLAAHEHGLPVMRPMILAFPDDRSVEYLDRQYMLGPDLLVAPVLSADGVVEYYLPAGHWTNLLTNETVTGGGWRTEQHDFSSMPLWVKENAVLVTQENSESFEADYSQDVLVTVYPGSADAVVTTTNPETGEKTTFTVRRSEQSITVSTDRDVQFSARIAGRNPIDAQSGTVELRNE